MGIIQGFIASFIILLLKNIITTLFTTNSIIQSHIYKLIPILSFQQILVSITLSMEGLVLGTKTTTTQDNNNHHTNIQSSFQYLALSTLLSTILSMFVLKYFAYSVHDILMYGINSLFFLRLFFSSYKVI